MTAIAEILQLPEYSVSRRREFSHTKTKFSGKLISVTVVRVTKDLAIARIYLSVFPSEFAQEILNEIELSNKQLRGELGRKLGKTLRVIPELQFYIDDSLDYIDNINRLIKS